MINSRLMLRILIPILLIMISCDPAFHICIDNSTNSEIAVIISPPIEFLPGTYETDIDTNLNRATYKIHVKGQGDNQIPIISGKGFFKTKYMDYMINGLDYIEIRTQSDTLIAKNKEQIKKLFWNNERNKYMRKLKIE